VVHTLALAEALAALGEHVTVWTLGRGGDTSFFRPVNPAVEVRVVSLPDVDGEGVGQRVLRSIDALAAAVDPNRYDVVHAQDCISANAVPGCVRTVHHLDAFTTPELAACHERAIVTPRAHVCVSAAVADELWRGWGIRATVIPNGVDADRFDAAAGHSPYAAAARAQWRDRIGRPYVLAVGGIEPRKGTLDLVEAFAILGACHRDHALVIAGGETLFDYRPYRASVDQRAAELGVTPIVLGPVPHDQLPALVAGADAFAFPSTKEGFGLAAMEAMAAGVPVVMRNLPVLREIFTGTARFADTPPGFAGALADALSAPTPGLVSAGRELARRHTWAAAAQAHEAFYRSVVNG
jgi:glycosyltransferase-like protein